MFKRHSKTQCAHVPSGKFVLSPPSNHHYLYNIAALIKGNPLPSAIHVPASASDANRIRKQDLSPPFTFCSFQPLEVTLGSSPSACSIIWHSGFVPSQVLVTILVLYFSNCWVNLNITEWVCSFPPPAPDSPLKKLQLKEMHLEQFNLHIQT